MKPLPHLRFSLRYSDIGTHQISPQMAWEELCKKLPRRFIDYLQRELV